MLKKLLFICCILFTTTGFLLGQEPVTVVVLGSSSALGTGASSYANSWAGRYNAYLKSINPNSKVVNFAQGGFTTGDILGNNPSADGSMALALAGWVGADLIIINLPSNDAYWNVPVTAQLANYQQALAMAAAKNVPVYITTTQPRNFEGGDRPIGDDYTPAQKRQNLMDMRDATLATYGVRAIDFWTDIANEDGTIKNEFKFVSQSNPGIHLNDAAHLILFNRVLSAINTEVKIAITLATPANNICKNQPVTFQVTLDESIENLNLALTYKIGQQPAVAFTGNSFTYNAPATSHIVTVNGVDGNNVVYYSNNVNVVLSNTCPKDAGQITAVVLGSSTAAAYGVNTQDGWVAQFETYLKSIHSGSLVYNLGVGGYSTYHIMPDGYTPPVGRPSPDIDKNITKALALNPDVIIINMPSNDAANGYLVSEQLANYAAIVAAAGSVPVYITTTQPRDLSLLQRENLMAMRVATLSTYNDKAINFWDGLANTDGTLINKYSIGDGTHLNVAGHNLVANRVLQANIIEPEISLTIGEAAICGGNVVNFTAAYPESLGELSLSYYVDRTAGVSFTGPSFPYTSPYINSRVYVVGKAANGDSYVSNIVYVTIDESCYEGDPISVVILGSSTSAGWGATGNYGWAQMYEDYLLSLHPGNTVNNYAVPGYSTIQILPTGTSGADPDRNITQALSHNPDVIIINMPSNDADYGYPVTDQLARYDVILAAAAAQNVPVYITTTQPRNLNLAGRQNLMAMRDSTFARFGEMAVDFWNGIATNDGYILNLYDDDGVHLNDAGHLYLFNRMINAGVVNPKIALTASASIVVPGQSVTFTATPNGPSITSYQYYVNRVLTETSASPTFTYTSPVNNYKVYVIGRDAANEPYTSNVVYVTVNPTPGLWTGAVDNNWFTPTNWYGNAVPDNTVAVIVNPTTNMPSILNGEANCMQLVINDGAMLTVGGGGKLTIAEDFNNNGELIIENQIGINGLASVINQGSITGLGVARVKLALPQNRWFYVSSAINGATFSNFDNNDPLATVYVYRNNQWYNTATSLPSMALPVLEGALVKYSNNHTLEYTGTLNNGVVSRNYATAGWYLLGNPYPSFIDWQNEAGWGRANIDATMWYRTLDDDIMKFITYNRLADPGARAAFYPGNVIGASAEAELSLIPPMQAVWVKALANNTTISVNNATRKHGLATSQLKSVSNGHSTADIIRITAANSHTRDGAVIYFSEQSADGFDSGDSEKRFNDSQLVPEVYTLIGNTAAAINGLKQLDNTGRTVPVSVRNRVSGDVTLNFNLELFQSQLSVNLEDKVTGNWVNLSATPEYTYTPVVLGEVHNRFVIHISHVPTSVGDPVEADGRNNEIVIKGIQGKAYIKINQELLKKGDAQIEVYTIDGQLLSKTRSGLAENEILLPHINALVVVKVIAGREVKSEKIMAKQ